MIFKNDWVDDRFEDYGSEDEWIEAYPDDPCPSCGCPGIAVGMECENCGVLHGPE